MTTAKHLEALLEKHSYRAPNTGCGNSAVYLSSYGLSWVDGRFDDLEWAIFLVVLSAQTYLGLVG